MKICETYGLHHALYERYESEAAACYDETFFAAERLESYMEKAGFGAAQQEQYRSFWRGMDEPLKRFLWLYYYIQYCTEVTFYRDIWQIEGMPLPPTVQEQHPGMIPVTVYMAAVPYLQSFAAQRGFDPQETVRHYFARFRDLSENNFRNYGHYGMVRLGAFLYAYSRMDSLVIGRLAYQKRVHHEFSYVYRRPDGTLLFVSSGAGTYDANGLQAETGWKPLFRREGDRLTAHVFDRDGRLERTPRTIDTTTLVPVLAPGDDVVTIHIPAQGRLTPELVSASLQEAGRRLPDLFPTAKAMVCTTWFIDPHIRCCLKEGSNLRAFAQRFACISAHDNKYHSLFEHIFGVSRDIPMTKLKPVNAFQQTMLDWCLADKKMYWGFGVLLDDPLE